MDIWVDFWVELVVRGLFSFLHEDKLLAGTERNGVASDNWEVSWPLDNVGIRWAIFLIESEHLANVAENYELLSLLIELQVNERTFLNRLVYEWEDRGAVKCLLGQSSNTTVLYVVGHAITTLYFLGLDEH